MGLKDIFRTVPTVTVAETKERSASTDEGPVILDVREPVEYRSGHVPGARHIPLSTLADRMGDLDPARPVITYCKAGRRSRSAAALLLGAGFADVRSMVGGMDAWEGLRATGTFDHGLSIITEGLAPGEVLGIARAFEGGSGEFYRGLAQVFADKEFAASFQALAGAEDAHLKAIDDGAAKLGITRFKEGGGKGLMEGAVNVKDALSWCREEGRTPFEALELAMQTETNSLDLYLKLLRRADIAPIRDVIDTVAGEEKNHLRRLAALLEKSA